MSVKEKFLDYVSYDTQSDSSSTTMPSTMKQKLLAQHLADEMVAMGIEDAHMDEWGYVYGTIPANCEKKNVVGFIAHMKSPAQTSKPASLKITTAKTLSSTKSSASSPMLKISRFSKNSRVKRLSSPTVPPCSAQTTRQA